MSKKINEQEFWITNASNKTRNIPDLRITIKPWQSKNLLDSRHYHFTLEQLEISAKTGSIAEKSKWIKVRQVAPQIIVQPGKYVSKDGRKFSPIFRSNVKIEEKHFEDLGDAVPNETEELKRISEEEFAAADADAAVFDYVPSLAVDKKFKEGV